MKEVLSLKQALLATINYFDILNFPITLEEIEEYLYGWSAPKETIEQIIGEIPEIFHSHGLYFLKGRTEIAQLRKEKLKIAQYLWKRVKHFQWLFALAPFVKMVAVCNTLAYGNVTNESDIDLFVITEEKKLSTARFFLKFLTQIFSLRAHHEKIAGRFCLSFFVTEKAMNLEPLAYDFDPHLAYFVALSKPLLGENTYRAWLQANKKWTSIYFKRSLKPNLGNIKEYRILRRLRKIFEFFLCFGGQNLENFFAKIQKKKDLERKKKCPSQAGIILNDDVFKFHEKDRREKISEEFEKRIIS